MNGGEASSLAGRSILAASSLPIFAKKWLKPSAMLCLLLTVIPPVIKESV